jgi:hypothetical protein
VAELNSIRIIARRVQIREENLYLLLTLLFSFSQYLYAGQTRCHVSMVVDNVMDNVASAMPSQHDLAAITCHHQHDSAATSCHSQRRLDNAIASMTEMTRHAHVGVGISPHYNKMVVE